MKLLLANSNMASEVASMVLAAAERFALPGTIRDRLRHLVRPRCHRRRNKAAVRWRAAGDPDDNIKPALARILDDILAGARGANLPYRSWLFHPIRRGRLAGASSQPRDE
jgi:hypothetical protein